MTDWLLALVPQYGLYLLAAVTFASCLALPVPASMLMLTAGGFGAAGDVSLPGAIAAALSGAIAGDQAGYWLSRRSANSLAGARLRHNAPAARAANFLAKRGGIAVFLSRWLFSALGPYVNLAAGAAGLPWLTFTLWGIAGEAVWVGLYVGLGYSFTGNIAAASTLALNLLGFLAAAAVAIGLGWWLMSAIRQERGG